MLSVTRLLLVASLLHLRVRGAETNHPLLLESDANSTYNDGIHLAIGPACGNLTGNASDINAGIPALYNFRTIVAFGDSYTDGGRHDGGPLAPPVVIPPDALAGGRSTNGKVWIENVADDYDMLFKDYAIAGAVSDLALWPSNPRPYDFLGEMTTFLSQNNTLDPATTLYVIFFGINDYIASQTDGDHLPQAAQVILDQVQRLSASPTNARYFLVADDYGRGVTTPDGEAFKNQIFSGLASSRQANASDFGFAYVNFDRIWNAVLNGPPGYQAFGYNNTGACLIGSGNSTVGMCDDPAHYFYWIPGHPSKQGHRIMADYTEEVVHWCKV